MNLKSRLGQQAFCLLFMVGGVVFLFALLLAMNDPQGPVEQRVEKQQLLVTVQQKKKPPKVRKRPAPRKASPRRTRSTAPRPSLSASLSGNSFGIPDLQGSAALDSITSAALDTDRAVRDLVMTESSVDEPPRPLTRTPPAYPARARARGITGKVVLGLLIDASGRVVKVKVLQSDPGGIFDQAAIDAVRDWQFEPARYQTQAVKVWARQTVRFRLS